MRIQEIDAFLAVCKYGSFTRAAEKTFTTQPTISQQIASLEREFGAQLIVRGKGQHAVTLTAAGQAFYPQAEKWASLWNETKTILSEQRTENYQFGCVGSFSEHAFAAVHKTFHEHEFNCNLKLIGRTSPDLFEMVENGSANSALVCQVRSSANVNIVPMASERQVFVCRADSDYDGLVHVRDLEAQYQVRLQWTLEVDTWAKHWFGSHAKPYVDISGARNPEGFFTHPKAWTLAPVSFLKNFRGDIRVCEIDNPPSDRLFYLISQTPIKEPFYTAIYDALAEVFAGMDGVTLLAK